MLCAVGKGERRTVGVGDSRLARQRLYRQNAGGVGDFGGIGEGRDRLIARVGDVPRDFRLGNRALRARIKLSGRGAGEFPRDVGFARSGDRTRIEVHEIGPGRIAEALRGDRSRSGQSALGIGESARKSRVLQVGRAGIRETRRRAGRAARKIERCAFGVGENRRTRQRVDAKRPGEAFDIPRRIHVRKDHRAGMLHAGVDVGLGDRTRSRRRECRVLIGGELVGDVHRTGYVERALRRHDVLRKRRPCGRLKTRRDLHRTRSRNRTAREVERADLDATCRGVFKGSRVGDGDRRARELSARIGDLAGTRNLHRRARELTSIGKGLARSDVERVFDGKRTRAGVGEGTRIALEVQMVDGHRAGVRAVACNVGRALREGGVFTNVEICRDVDDARFTLNRALDRERLHVHAGGPRVVEDAARIDGQPLKIGLAGIGEGPVERVVAAEFERAGIADVARADEFEDIEGSGVLENRSASLRYGDGTAAEGRARLIVDHAADLPGHVLAVIGDRALVRERAVDSEERGGVLKIASVAFVDPFVDRDRDALVHGVVVVVRDGC